MLITALIISGLALLYLGGEFLVKGGVAIATRCGVSPLVIGLTLVAYATSAPELLVSVTASLNGNADISIGNVVGSNICNIALILGLSAAIWPLTVKKQLLSFDMPFLLAITLAFAALAILCNGVPRWAGALFFTGSVAYTVIVVAKARRGGENDAEPVAATTSGWLVAAVLVLGGIAMLVGGSHLLVKGAVLLAQLFGVPDVVIGLTVVAIGTSMPELATSVVAALKHESDIAIGNIIGSCIFNILCIMGIAPMIRPLREITVSPLDWAVFSGVTLLLYPMMLTGRKLSRTEGVLLLAIYASYTFILIKSYLYR